MTSRILKEPLLHFLLLGGALFVVFAIVRKEESDASDDQIVVSAGRIEQLANLHAKTWQRPPSDQELRGLIDDFVLEEIYYRQAREMGLDRDDTVIRRRLRQKLEFLTDDAAKLIEPSDEELSAYLASNQDGFRRDSAYTFRQVFIDPDKHGENVSEHVAAQLEKLRSDQPVISDSGLLPEEFREASGRTADATFGRGFAAQLDELALGSWEGPLRSGLGLHLVKVMDREDGEVPELTEIREVVEREWANEKRLEMRQKVNEKLRDEYEIVIEWPEEK